MNTVTPKGTDRRIRKVAEFDGVNAIVAIPHRAGASARFFADWEDLIMAAYRIDETRPDAPVAPDTSVQELDWAVDLELQEWGPGVFAFDLSSFHHFTTTDSALDFVATYYGHQSAKASAALVSELVRWEFAEELQASAS
ncbi:MAG TPA: hypothetical protein VMV52_10980 [Candidatus Nanopelagicaceae bacterium]|nr:hypothetical protein [Candidatus Nanopelagicaceae bacterium]